MRLSKCGMVQLDSGKTIYIKYFLHICVQNLEYLMSMHGRR